ncbi:MAG TPA: hypothetical protein PK295_01530 [Candidatus Magasanikbacteria bacterium]|nr:hypothetical protein [Candidatus Magasanikbacteria bacterium]
MNDVIKFGKKLFSASVVGVTIAWSMGLAAFVPVAAQAATCPELEAGDLFKASGASAVYYLTAGMERAYFPHEDVFKSWNLSFSDVVTVSGECLFAYPSATVAGINYRPGSRLVKLSDAPSVFAITPGNKLVQVTGESAAALYGSNWASSLRDVSPFHWANYTDTRTTWSESKPHDGQFVKKTGETAVYWVKDGALVRVDGTNIPDVRTVSAATFATLSVASGSVTVSSAYANPTQVDGSAPTPTTGALTVSLASNTSASKVVPGGTQGVDYLAFTVRAGSSAGTLEQVTLKRAGIGSRNDFSKVYLYHNGVRVDNGRSLTTDDLVTFNVNKSIAANSSETFWVKADMDTLVGDSTDATSGDQNYFEIRTASDVKATGSVGGSFPVRGNSITIGAQDIGTLTVAGVTSAPTAKIGQNDVVVGEFDVTATSDDVELTSVTLKQRGTAPASVLTNVKLMQGGTVLAQGVVSGDWVKFDFTQKFKIEDGDTKRFKVYADVGIADTSDTVKLVLDAATDIMAYSVDFPGNLAGVTTNSYTTSQTLTLTIEGGKINVDFDGTNGDVRVDQNDVVFGTFTILATAEDLDVDSMRFILMRPNSAVCPEDLRLRDKNGKGSYSLDFDDTCATGTDNEGVSAENLILTKGVTYEFEVVGDIASTAVSGDAYYFTWAATSTVAEGVTSDNTVSSNDFSSATLTGPTMTVQPSSLTVRGLALTNETVVGGSKGVLIFRGTLEAGSTSDVVVTSLNVDRNAGSAAWDSLLDSMKLYIAPVGEAVDTATDLVATDNTITDEKALFTGLNHTVKAGSANKVNFEVRVDVASSGSGTVKVEVDDIDATDEDSDDVTAVNSSGTSIATSPVVADRLLTISGTGEITAQIDTNYTGLRNDHYVLAGSQKHLAGRVQLRAINEDVKLKDLVIFATSTDGGNDTATILNNTFDSVTLYEDAAMTMPLATSDFSGGAGLDGGVTSTLEDVNYVVPRDTTKYLYIGLNVNSIGTGDNGTATSSVDLKLRLVDSGTTAEGVSSKTDLAAGDVDVTEGDCTTTNGGCTKMMTVVGAQITNVATSFASSDLVGGEQTFFTFSVTGNAGSNTDASGDALDILLTSLKLQLSTDASSVTGTKLCRVSTGNCIDLTTSTPWSSPGTLHQITQAANATTVDLTTFSNADDRRIISGETVQFEVRGTFSGVTDKFAQGSLQDVDSSGIVWGYDLDNNNVNDASFTDLKKMEPRWSGYPDVVGGTLN